MQAQAVAKEQTEPIASAISSTKCSSHCKEMAGSCVCCLQVASTCAKLRKRPACVHLVSASGSQSVLDMPATHDCEPDRDEYSLDWLPALA